MNNFISQNEKTFSKKKKRWKPKGRQIEYKFFNEIQSRFKGKSIVIEELIE